MCGVVSVHYLVFQHVLQTGFTFKIDGSCEGIILDTSFNIRHVTTAGGWRAYPQLYITTLHMHHRSKVSGHSADMSLVLLKSFLISRSDVSNRRRRQKNIKVRTSSLLSLENEYFIYNFLKLFFLNGRRLSKKQPRRVQRRRELL